MILPAIPPTGPATPKAVGDNDIQARAAAKAFEASFLAEMLKSSGLNTAPDGFDGGAGEQAFSGFLTQEYARLMSERGGIGLAEHVFEALKQRQGA